MLPHFSPISPRFSPTGNAVTPKIAKMGYGMFALPERNRTGHLPGMCLYPITRVTDVTDVTVFSVSRMFLATSIRLLILPVHPPVTTKLILILLMVL